MIVSSKGRYALRVMTALARQEQGGYIPLKDIAESEGISRKYLESIMGLLSKGGLVDASHGKNGGYRLNRPAEAYTVGSILRLTEGDLAPVACDADCGRNCPSRAMWDRLGKLIDDFFDGITLADLMEDGEGKEKER
ncbi:MAG: Rrf2 family transcriptional regulator [Oscillospiraceae bacterium]|nr:Rrf2 family transcriptional regulator [Oscillospiraceae bacterium]